jgi:hypothetical protein
MIIMRVMYNYMPMGADSSDRSKFCSKLAGRPPSASGSAVALAAVSVSGQATEFRVAGVARHTDKLLQMQHF